MLQQPRPDRPRRIVFLVLEFDGNDDVRVYGPERHAQLVADLLAPAFGLSQRVLVADDDRRAHFIGKGQQPMMRVSPHDEADTSLAQAGADVSQALHEKPVVAAVRALDEGVQSEEGHDRQAKLVAEPNGHVECGIVHGPLGALHPVDDAAAVRIGLALRTNRHPRVVTQCQRHLRDKIPSQRERRESQVPGPGSAGGVSRQDAVLPRRDGYRSPPRDLHRMPGVAGVDERAARGGAGVQDLADAPDDRGRDRVCRDSRWRTVGIATAVDRRAGPSNGIRSR